MKKILILTILILGLTTTKSFCAPLISGISTNEINIDTKFKGAQILLFGAKGDAGNIVITVRGPKKNFFVTRKEKIIGIWYNATRLKFENSYSFFSLFSSYKGLEVDEEILHDLELTKDFLQFSNIQKYDEKTKNDFKIELIEEMERRKLYNNTADKVDFLDDTLFKIMLNFPKNIVQGVYTVELYLIKENSLISFQSIPIYVNQVGISAKISEFSHQQEIFYGLVAVILALVVGWITNYIFMRFIGQ